MRFPDVFSGYKSETLVSKYLFKVNNKNTRTTFMFAVFVSFYLHARVVFIFIFVVYSPMVFWSNVYVVNLYQIFTIWESLEYSKSTGVMYWLKSQ